MDLRDSCAALVRRAKSNFYYAFVFLPRPRREAIFAAYAFSRHTDDLVDDAESPEAAERELAAWRDELDACYRGRPTHPVTQSLREAIDRYAIPREHFENLVDGVEMDLHRSRYATFDELSEYCYKVASTVGLICIEIFGYSNPAARDYAVNLGLALQLTNIIRDVGDDAGRDRIYLPAEDLDRFGYSEPELMSHTHNQAFTNLMAFQCRRARRFYDRAADLLPEEDRSALFSAEIMGRIYSRMLQRVERTGFRVFEGQVRIGNLSKLWIALRTWIASRFAAIRRPRQ